MHVGDAVLALEDPGALQLDVVRREVVKQAAPLPEEHRDEMELKLVEEAGGERELRRRGARGPPDYPATFETHDLTPGGKATYIMTGPNGTMQASGASRSSSRRRRWNSPTRSPVQTESRSRMCRSQSKSALPNATPEPEWRCT